MEKLESIIDSNIRIIDMKALLKKVVAKWWVILICACLMCGAALIRSNRSAAEAADEETIRKYTEQAESNQLLAASLQDYIDHSYWFEIDPVNVKMMQYVYDFSSLENADGLQNRYYEYLLNDLDYGSYRNDLDEKYIREQTEIVLMQETAGIKVSVTGRDEEDAIGLMDYIDSSLQKYFAGEQSPAVLKNDEILTVTKSDTISRRSNITTALTNANTSAQSATDELLKIENDSKAVRINQKSLILFGLIGIVGAVLVLMLINVLKGTVLSAEELQKQYLLPDLGNTENADALAERINKRIGDRKKVILVSDSKSADLSTLAKAVGDSGLNVPVRVCESGRIEADEDTLAVIAVRPGQSVYREINQLMRSILSEKGEIAGTVICQ